MPQEQLKQEYSYQYQETTKNSPKYQTYRHLNSRANQLRELMFFIQIGGFSLGTIISCLVLLSVGLHPVLAFPIGMMTSFSFLLASKIYFHTKSKR